MSAGAARRCGRCGRVRPISVRASAAGPDICAGCYRAPEATCAGCGRCRPCTGIAAGRPICARCRPRRTRVCARCGLARPPATTWPEGPVCDPCYTAALRRRGPCSGCGRQRRLVAPPGPAATTCADCSDAPGPAGHVCADCGREDKLYARGRCARCSLRVRLDALLAAEGGQPPAALVGVRDAIVAAEHPRTALNWLRGGAGAPMLAASPAVSSAARTRRWTPWRPAGPRTTCVRCWSPTACCPPGTRRWPGSSAGSPTCSTRSRTPSTGGCSPPSPPGGCCTGSAGRPNGAPQRPPQPATPGFGCGPPSRWWDGWVTAASGWPIYAKPTWTGGYSPDLRCCATRSATS